MRIYIDGQYIESTRATEAQKMILAQQRPLLYQEVYNAPPPTKKRAKMYSNFQVYQIFYDTVSHNKLDQGFIPYNNIGQTHNYENDVIINIWLSHRREWMSKKFVGVLSWRFFEKTEMTASKLYAKLKKTDADIVTMSPKLYEGQKHPYIREGFGTVTSMCRVADEHRLFTFKMSAYPAKHIVWCNYWVARPEIFDLYCSKYLSKAISFFRDNKNPEIRKMYDLKEKHRAGSEYIAMTFFLEGLFSVFIQEEKLKVLAL